jgi:hypothetical protein
MIHAFFLTSPGKLVWTRQRALIGDPRAWGGLTCLDECSQGRVPNFGYYRNNNRYIYIQFSMWIEYLLLGYSTKSHPQPREFQE